jgi:hypothetical protein
MDKFPIGVIMNKGLTIRTAQQNGHRYMRRLLDHKARSEMDVSFMLTHRLSLEDGQPVMTCLSAHHTYFGIFYRSHAPVGFHSSVGIFHGCVASWITRKNARRSVEPLLVKRIGVIGGANIPSPA